MDGYLEMLQDPTKKANKARIYRQILLAVEKDASIISLENCDKLIQLFDQDLLRDIQYASFILGTINIVSKRIEDKTLPEFSSLPSLAKTILNFLAMIASRHQVQNVQSISLEALLAYPPSSLASTIEAQPNRICSLMTQYMGNSNMDVKLSVLELLLKWLDAVPVEKRFDFVKNGLDTWFSHLVPMLFVPSEAHRVLALGALENILPELAQIDYLNNAQWVVISNNLKDKANYNAFMLKLFGNEDPHWHRQLCCMANLFERQLQKDVFLINSLLPVLELAFRVEKSRKEAFSCWKILIKIYTSKILEQSNIKIIKLLSVPLKMNNAKTEDIAIFKLDVWWYLIVNLRENIYTYTDLVLYQFLQFCFGTEQSNHDVVPGLVFPAMQALTVKYLVEIFGHEDSCSGCVGEYVIPAHKPIFNQKLLEDGVNRWTDTIKQIVLYVSRQVQDEKTKSELLQNVKCIWASLIKVSRSMNNAPMASTIFKNILETVQTLCDEYSKKDNIKLSEILFHHMIPTIVDRSKGYSVDFLNSNIIGLEHTPIQALLLLILSSKWRTNETVDTHALFKELVTIGLDGSVVDFCGWILPQLSHESPSSELWCHLASTLSDQKYSYNKDICDAIILWPFNHNLDFKKVLSVVAVWKKMYNYIIHVISSPKKKATQTFDESILSIIMKVRESELASSKMMCLFTLSLVIKRRLEEHPAGQVTYLSSLLEALQWVLCQVKKMDMSDLTMAAIFEVAETVGVVLSSYNSRRATPFYVQLLIKISESTTKSVLEVLEKLSFFQQIDTVKIVNCLPFYLIPTLDTKLTPCITNIILLIVKRDNTPETITKCEVLLRQVLEIHGKSACLKENTIKKIECLLKNSLTNGKSFKLPIIKSAEKKTTKKDNLEDKASKETEDIFVAIKPSWKFDPKKLTDHQKEVLTRRRENIPALYEDLSQSQDDYSMKVWKPTGYTNTDGTTDTSRSQEQDDNSRSKPVPTEAMKESDNEKNNVHEDEIINEESLKTDSTDKSNKNDPITDTNGEISKKNEKTDENSPKSDQNSVKKILRNIPNPDISDGLIDTNSPQVKDINKGKKSINGCKDLNDSNIENIQLSIIASPKILNRRNSLQSRLERNLKKLQERSLDICSTPPLQNTEKTCESERPSRNRRKPKKFESDDIVLLGNRRVSTSIIEMRSNSPIKVSDSEKILKTATNQKPEISENLLPKTEENTKITPTKIKKKKVRLLKNLEIDTVEGHPNKEIFEQDTPKSIEENPNKRRRSSIRRKCDEELIGCLSKKQKLKSSKEFNNSPNEIRESVPHEKIKLKQDSDHLKSDTKHGESVTPPKISVEEIIIPDIGHEVAKSPDLPESEDVIESSQDSSTSSIKTPRRISAVINGKVKTSTQKIDLLCNSLTPCKVIVNLDNSLTSIPTSKIVAEADTLPIRDNETDIFIEEKEETTSNETPLDSNRVAEADTEPIETVIQLSCGLVTINLIETKNEDSPTKIDADKLTVTDENSFKNDEQIDTNEQMDTDEQMNIEQMNTDEQMNIEQMNTDEQMNVEQMNTDEQMNVEQMNIDEHMDTDEKIQEDNQDEQNASQVIIDIIDLSDDNESGNCSMGIILSSPYKDDVEDRNAELLNSTIDISPIKCASFEDNTTMMDEKTQVLESNDLVTEEHTSDDDAILTTEKNETIENVDLTTEKKDLSVEEKSESPISELNINVEKSHETKSSSPNLSQEDKIAKESVADESITFNLCSPPKNDTSPEILCTENISPERVTFEENNWSPPRNSAIFSSPLKSTDHKLIRPRINRTSGRAAHMLVLCRKDIEINEYNIHKQIKILSPVRKNVSKNLRTLYGNNMTEDDEPVLEFSKTLPSPHASPVGPILKRTCNDQVSSPSSKKKRVSFHDPPVSTTKNVEKYISSPSCVRSPQQKARTELGFSRSPRVVKCLVKKIETDEILASTLDDNVRSESDMSEMCSLVAETPQSMDIQSFHLLDDAQPIYPSLCGCNVPISAIGAQLSSPLCKDMFINNVKDEITTIGDLAKLTELQVNRLPIKYPKIETVKNVLTSFEAKQSEDSSKLEDKSDEAKYESENIIILSEDINEPTIEIIESFKEIEVLESTKEYSEVIIEHSNICNEEESNPVVEENDDPIPIITEPVEEKESMEIDLEPETETFVNVNDNEDPIKIDDMEGGVEIIELDTDKSKIEDEKTHKSCNLVSCHCGSNFDLTEPEDAIALYKTLIKNPAVINYVQNNMAKYFKFNPMFDSD